MRSNDENENEYIYDEIVDLIQKSVLRTHQMVNNHPKLFKDERIPNAERLNLYSKYRVQIVPNVPWYVPNYKQFI